MASAQVALNGLQRCLSYTQAQRDSSSTFYSSSVESLKQIRELASQIMIASNEALSKVGLEEPLSIVKDHPCDLVESDEFIQKVSEISSKVASEVANQVIFQVLNQFNLVNQQNISINHVDQYNQYSESLNLSEILEADCTDQENPGKIEEQTQISGNSIKSSTFIHDFKQVLREVHTLSVEKFSSPEIKLVSDLVFDYFDVRFNKKYDPNQIHWFSRKRFRDYLASILISYSRSVVVGESFKFYTNFENWLEDIQKSPSKYTLPVNCSSVYFNILVKDASQVSEYLDIEVVQKFKEIWAELWELGYYKFKNLSDDWCLPDKSLSWIQSNLECCAQNHDLFDDAVSLVINELCDTWKSLETCESFSICRAIAIRSNLSLQNLDYEDVVKLPQDLIQKSLQLYVSDNGIESLDRLKMKLKSIQSIVNDADSKCDSLEEKYRYLSQFPPSDLELVEVLEHYAANIAEVDNNEI